MRGSSNIRYRCLMQPRQFALTRNGRRSCLRYNELDKKKLWNPECRQPKYVLRSLERTLFDGIGELHEMEIDSSAISYCGGEDEVKVTITSIAEIPVTMAMTEKTARD